jgi:hypothetical protein
MTTPVSAATLAHAMKPTATDRTVVAGDKHPRQPPNLPRENSEMRPFWIDFENTANPRQVVIVDSTE